jgi:hypothetical protein
MSSPTHIAPGSKEHRRRGCESKRRHPDHVSALAFAIERMEKNPGLKLDVYPCQFCNGWHLCRTSSARAEHKLFRRQQA